MALFLGRVTASDKSSAQIPAERSAVQSHGSHSRRKVFYLLDSLNVGGTETQAVELALRIPAAGYDVTLGCLRAQGPLLERIQGTAVSLREFHPEGGIDTPAGLYQLLRLSWFLRRGKFDVVHTHDLWSNLLGIPAARLAGVPAIVSSRRDLGHLDWYQSKRRGWLRRIQNLSGAVLVNATPVRDALISEDGFAPEKLRVIHNGVDVEKFHAGRDGRERLFPGVGGGKLIVLVGNMHSDVKGHPWLIASAPAVIREFPSTRFVLVGDGPQRGSFEQQVAGFGLERSFLFLGRRDDVPEILACCDIAVLPSRAEGLPNAVLECMAAGLPTVVSRVGGNADLVQEGVTGLLVPPEDSPALSAALLRLLRDPDLARQMARAGQDFIVRNFSFERLVREVDALYTDLLQRAGRNH
jgi:glycosyltransferase involved in cell wall biosynthesis